MKPPKKPDPTVMAIKMFFWTPCALVLGGLGLAICLTVIGIPIGLGMVFLAALPYARWLIKYNKAEAEWSKVANPEPYREAGHIVKPWDVSVTMGDTTAHEGWYNSGQPQGTTGRAQGARQNPTSWVQGTAAGQGTRNTGRRAR